MSWTVATTADGGSQSVLDANADGVPDQIWSTTSRSVLRDRDADGNAEAGNERSLDSAPPDSAVVLPDMDWWEDRDDDGAVDLRCRSTWEGAMGRGANLVATERSRTECSKGGAVEFRYEHAFSEACLTLPSDRFALPSAVYFAPNLAARIYRDGAEGVLGLAPERAFRSQLRAYFSIFTRETFERVPLLGVGSVDPVQLVRSFE
jgi:hypothetical protein